MSRKKTIRELYFYKKPGSDLYAVDIITGRNEYLHKEISNVTRTDITKLLDQLANNKHNQYVESRRGMKIYSKFPKDRVISHQSTNIVDVYLDNLKELQESHNSRQKAANLLRAAADMIDDPEGEDYQSEVPKELDYPIEPPCGVEPEPAVDKQVPFEVIDHVQSGLNVDIDFDNLTFWFNQQKWQLHCDIDELPASLPKRPKASPTINNSMDYMMNLLGVNGDKSLDPNSLFVRFDLDGKMYKISHVYTSDRNQNFGL